jgi:hypothetical protein
MPLVIAVFDFRNRPQNKVAATDRVSGLSREAVLSQQNSDAPSIAFSLCTNHVVLLAQELVGLCSSPKVVKRLFRPRSLRKLQRSV